MSSLNLTHPRHSTFCSLQYIPHTNKNWLFTKHTAENSFSLLKTIIHQLLTAHGIMFKYYAVTWSFPDSIPVYLFNFLAPLPSYSIFWYFLTICRFTQWPCCPHATCLPMLSLHPHPRLWLANSWSLFKSQLTCHLSWVPVANSFSQEMSITPSFVLSLQNT